MKIKQHSIGTDHRPYVIAEIGSNHNGDMDLCRKLIDAAAEAGADAAKFQSWSDKSLVSRAEYQANTEYSDTKKHFGSLEDMVREYMLTPDQHLEAAKYCRSKGIEFCSSPFSNEEVDLLVSLDVPFLKTASMDINNLPFLEYVARTGLPMIMSTGMASLGEIETALDVVEAAGNDNVAILHCIAIYPPEMDTVNLRNIPQLRETFGVPVGFSDHTIGTHIPLAAITLGASIIEKHFTLDKDMEGWDHAVSATPDELRTIVTHGRQVHEALGTAKRVVSPAEKEKRAKFRRSAVASHALSAGHVLSEKDLLFKRPGTGIGPDRMDLLVGRTLRVDIQADGLLSLEHLV